MTEPPSRALETAMALALFVTYVALWQTKRRQDIRRTGHDPDVLRAATTSLQRYFGRLVRVITWVVVTIVTLHALAPTTWPPLVRVSVLDSRPCDVLGFTLGALGLSLAALAQRTMGASWRVGIDLTKETELVRSGIYRWIRNPTYVGLHLVSVGLWFIWPTTLVAFYGVLFFLITDIQVRCEEDYLLATHGKSYARYTKKTWRYVPFFY